MKKIIIILLVLLTVCGCEDSNKGDAKISKEKEEVYFKYDGKEYTNNDAFQKLKAQQVASYFENLIANKAAEVEGIKPEQDETAIEEEYQSLIDMYGEEMTNAYFGKKEQYIKNSLIRNTNTSYLKTCIKEKIDEYTEKYPTIYVESISSTNKSKMNSFLKRVKKSKDFDKAFKQTKFKESEEVIREVIELSSSNLPEEVLNELNNMKVDEISKLIEVDGEETTTYFIYRIISDNPKDDYFDEFFNYLSNNNKIDSATMFVKEKHDIKIYDDDFNNQYQNILKQFETTESEAE